MCEVASFKNFENSLTTVKVMKKLKWPLFIWDTVYIKNIQGCCMFLAFYLLSTFYVLLCLLLRMWFVPFTVQHVSCVTCPLLFSWNKHTQTYCHSFIHSHVIKTTDICRWGSDWWRRGRRASDLAVIGSIPGPCVIRHLRQLSLPSLRGR